MDKTFVKNAEDDVNHQNGHDEQDAQAFDRRLKYLR